MNKIILLLAAVLPAIFLTSCATPPPPQVAFHHTDGTALVLKSVDAQNCQMLQPSTSNQAKNDEILSIARSLPEHRTAVVMLENYTEPRLGEQFRNRGTPLFIGLRSLGYQHIIFVQGQNVPDPNGLIILAEYN